MMLKKTKAQKNQGLSDSNTFVQNVVLVSPEWVGFAIYNSWIETVRQYRRTILGPLWLIIGQVVYILGIAFVYTSIFKTDPKTIMPYLSSGIIIWTFISTVFSTAANVLISYGSIVGSFRLPFNTFVMQNIFRYLILLAHGLIIHLVVMMMYYSGGFNLNILLFIPGLILVLAVLYPLSILLGVLGARFRDIGPATGAIVYFLFLVSPIIWRPSTLPADRAFLVELNPVYHMMTIIRSPILFEPTSINEYYINIGMAVVLSALAYLVCKTLGKRIVFWL